MQGPRKLFKHEDVADYIKRSSCIRRETLSADVVRREVVRPCQQMFHWVVQVYLREPLEFARYLSLLLAGSTLCHAQVTKAIAL